MTGQDNNIYTNAENGLGQPFTAWELRSGLQSNVGPAITVAKYSLDEEDVVLGLPIVVATGTDGHIYYNASTSSKSTGWVLLDEFWSTPVSPAAALVGDDGPYVPGGYLFVISLGYDGQLYVNQGNIGSTFVGWQAMGFSSYYAAGLTSSGNTSVVVATGTNGTVYYNWWTLGGGSSGWYPLPGLTSSFAPAAALVGANNDYLFVIAVGSNNLVYCNQLTLGGTYVGWNLL